MSRRPEHIDEITCFYCPVQDKCAEKIERSPKLSTIRDKVFNDADAHYYIDCTLYNAISYGGHNGQEN